MAGRIVRLAATAAALAAVLVGMSRGWDLWTVLKRAGIGYAALYVVGTLLVVLARLALLPDSRERSETTGNSPEPHGTDGTNPAA